MNKGAFHIDFHLLQWLLAIVLGTMINASLSGQAGYIEEQPEVEHLIDRQQTLLEWSGPHSTLRQYPILALKGLDSVVTDYNIGRMFPEIEYLAEVEKPKESEERPRGFFNQFYKTPYSFFLLEEEDLFLKIDPVFHFSVGDDREDDGLIFQNTRGIRIRGIIDQKIYFSSNLLETQKRYLNYENDEIRRLNAIPGQSFFKAYDADIFGGLRGWDHLNAQAFVGGQISKSIDVRLGHGRHFIGDGIRSLLISDYGTNYFYLQLNTRVWKLHYQNTFAELSASSGRETPGDPRLVKKYMASHYLDFRPSDRFSIGIFESVIFGTPDRFELQYLNPVILYRSLERNLNSPDNALFGFNVKWIPAKSYQLYGQLMFDELRISELFSGDGWWGNKVAYQLGLKKFNLFNVDRLDLQLEYNTARPYTYTHRGTDINGRPVASYSHYNQPLAHPLGANFRETILKIQYQPIDRLHIQATALLASYGTDPNTNVGRDILLDYDNRLGDFGQITGQGLDHDIFSTQLRASWQLIPGYYVDLDIVLRRHDIESARYRTTSYLGLGFRANIWDRALLL